MTGALNFSEKEKEKKLSGRLITYSKVRVCVLEWRKCSALWPLPHRAPSDERAIKVVHWGIMKTTVFFNKSVEFLHVINPRTFAA